MNEWIIKVGRELLGQLNTIFTDLVTYPSPSLSMRRKSLSALLCSPMNSSKERRPSWNWEMFCKRNVIVLQKKKNCQRNLKSQISKRVTWSMPVFENIWSTSSLKKWKLDKGWKFFCLMMPHIFGISWHILNYFEVFLLCLILWTW